MQPADLAWGVATAITAAGRGLRLDRAVLRARNAVSSELLSLPGEYVDAAPADAVVAEARAEYRVRRALNIAT